MAELNKITICGKETPALRMDKDGSLTLAENSAKQEQNGFLGFFSSLIAAHRYAHNRRTAAQ